MPDQSNIPEDKAPMQAGQQGYTPMPDVRQAAMSGGGVEAGGAEVEPETPAGEDSATAGSAAESDSKRLEADFGAAFPDQYWMGEDNTPTGNGDYPRDSNVPADKDDSAPVPEEDASDDEKTMGLLDHLNELRSRLTRACIAAVMGFAICWAFVDPLFDTLIRPLMTVLPEGTHAQYTTLPEAFFTRMYIAFVAGLFLASPAIFYQIWAFVAPGLYDDEKRYIIPIALLSAIFFTGGAAFCYFIVFPYAFAFFISYSTPEIVITPKMSDYLSFTLKLLFAFGLIFEMPIFTLFLSRLGIITASMMRRVRKYAIVAIFIVAAILTPPDVLSQILMALPMLLLYEISIGVAIVFGKKKTPVSKEEDEDDKSAENAEASS